MTTLPLNSGTQIPQIGFGTYRTGDAAGAAAQALRVGYRHLDTAQMYGNEAGVGEGIRASGVPREDIFVTTKLNNGNHHPDDVRRTFDASLEALGMDSVDLFLIHWPARQKGVELVDTWRTVLELAESGRTAAVGVSNFHAQHLEELVAATGVVPAVNQVEIHPYFANNALREYCGEQGIVVEAWSPLGRGDEFADPVIRDLAQKLAVTPAQLILRWHLQRGDVVIPKSDDPQRMRQNADLRGFELTEQEMATVDGLDRGEGGRRGANPDNLG